MSSLDLDIQLHKLHLLGPPELAHDENYTGLVEMGIQCETRRRQSSENQHLIFVSEEETENSHPTQKIMCIE